MQPTLLVVGMQNDKLHAMRWGGEDASMYLKSTVPMTPHFNAFRDEVSQLAASDSTCRG